MEKMGIDPPESMNMETGFCRRCGKCKDPCAAMFHPEMNEDDMGMMKSKILVIENRIKVTEIKFDIQS